MNEDYRFEVYTEYSGYGDKVYVVKYFDLDNVIGVGDTIDEAIREAKGNLDVFLDYCKKNNISVPSPSSHEDSNYSGKITVRMSRKLHKLVDERAKREGISINLLLNEAISNYVSSANTGESIVEESAVKVSELVKDALEDMHNYPNVKNNWIEIRDTKS